MAQGRFVAYHRVSTAKQGRSGLGLDAQRAAVLAYLNGGNWKLLAEFTEVESGKRADRPELAKALAHCRLTGATLIISKMDRLSRNMAFTANLMDGGVDFVACDNPHATRFSIHILAAVAEHEAKQISTRTKAALAAAKARGAKLGGYKGGPVPVAADGGAAGRAKADAFAGQVAPIVRQLQDAGMGLRGIAAELAQRGIRTPRGGLWTAQAVKNLLARV